jgi:MarR family 2-MHQ and catechol resistance regulon transcriptional repressor
MPTKYRGSADEVRALSALINLMRAADAFAASLPRELSGTGLTASQFAVLEALLHLGPLCQGDLAGKLLRSCGSITSVVDGLEAKKLVERRRDGADKRFVTVSLTAAGGKLIKRVFPAHARTTARQFRALTPAEQEELRRLCRKLGTSLAPGAAQK